MPQSSRGQKQRVRHESQQENPDPVADSGNDHAFAAHQAIITDPQHTLGRKRKHVGHPTTKAGARLKLGRHRTGAKRGDPDAALRQFLVQSLAEREHERLAGIINGHTGPRHEGGNRGDVEDAAAMTREALHESERQFGERADVEIDHRELFVSTELIRPSDEPEGGIVDHDLRLKSARPQLRRETGDGIAALEIHSQQCRTLPAACCELGADAGRRAGNQRDRPHAPPGSPASFAIR